MDSSKVDVTDGQVHYIYPKRDYDDIELIDTQLMYDTLVKEISHFPQEQGNNLQIEEDIRINNESEYYRWKDL